MTREGDDVTGPGTDAHHRAVGRWIVEFSRLVMFMRLAIELRLARGVDLVEAKIVLGEASADQITGSFFELCSHCGEPNEAETKSLKCLKGQVREQISRRNDFAHGDWLGGSPEGLSIWRTKPGKKGAAWGFKEPSPDDLDDWSESLRRLGKTVGEVGLICLDPDIIEGVWGRAIRLEDVFRYRPGDSGKRGQSPRSGSKAAVTRDGPLAEPCGAIFGL